MAGGLMTLFLCGDVMLGRGVDQILPHPGDPELREGHVSDARSYVRLAEQTTWQQCGRTARGGYAWSRRPTSSACAAGTAHVSVRDTRSHQRGG
jgi:poly-gamma-glutamate capsule biosynthesis protein CapA/YwtB (metallophosphatase superfamily)